MIAPTAAIRMVRDNCLITLSQNTEFEIEKNYGLIWMNSKNSFVVFYW